MRKKKKRTHQENESYCAYCAPLELALGSEIIPDTKLQRPMK